MTPLTQKTIFVVGTGSSKEVNLPIGFELKKEIAEVLKWSNESDYFADDNIINHALKTKHEKEPLFKPCEIISRAISIDIDNFLDVHSDNEEIIYSVSCVNYLVRFGGN